MTTVIYILLNKGFLSPAAQAPPSPDDRIQVIHRHEGAMLGTYTQGLLTAITQLLLKHPPHQMS
jgi:hypothetical protein